MRYVICGVILSVGLAGCTLPATPSPPVPPPLEDLSTWSIPELIQPQKSPVARSIGQADRKPTKAEQVAGFAEGTLVVVPVAVGVPLDIVFEQGEGLLNVVGGDRAPVEGGQPARWEVKKGASGEGETLQPHLFVTVTEPGLITGFALTTTRRTYLVTCKSVAASPIRVLRWTYPASIADSLVKTKDPGILPDPEMPARYHVGYSLNIPDPRPAWVPNVFDDGRKTYLIFSAVVLYTEMPLIREVTTQGPALINTRQFGPVVILDKMIQRLELRFGTGDHAQILTIVRDALRTIRCPGDAQCPVFPRIAGGTE